MRCRRKMSVTLQRPVRTFLAHANVTAASADRRPVDPPPIVELKITEPDNGNADVTSSMNANYFLFATLEQARNIGHGRVGEDKQQRLTVLTGTPVAGMVYLERPEPAGYFIFQDLSVRHEGKYRLCFNLYEELKEPRDSGYDDGRQSSPDDAHVTHRMDVKSAPFVVYSAKRFPGLTSSTSLSRTVAEQGCRVRIRRDVRMRRPRDAKAGGKDWDGYEDETAETRGRVSATPEAPPPNTIILPAPPSYAEATGRPRSSSNASHRTLPDPLSRRTSLQEMNQAYNQPHGSGPNTPQQAYGHFGSASRDQYTASYVQQPPVPPPQLPPASYPAPQYHGYGANAMPALPPPPIQYAATSQYVPEEHRRSSSQYGTANTQAPPPPVPQPMQPAYSTAPDSWVRPPIPPPPMHQPSVEYRSAAPAPWSRMPALPPVSLPKNSMHTKLEPTAPPASTFDPYPTLPRTTDLQPSEPQPIHPSESYKSSDVFQPASASKRTLNEAFHYGTEGPAKQGARPSETPHPFARASSAFLTSQHGLLSDDQDGDSAQASVYDLQYRRSTGATRTRPGHYAPPPSGSGHY